jgi:hypothetical protein
MTKQSLNYNVLLIVGGAIAVMYFWNKNKTAQADVLDSRLPIVESRTDRVEIRQNARTERQENVIDAVKSIFTKKDTLQDNTTSSKLKSSSTNKQKLDYNTSTGVLKVNNQGFSVAPEKANTLRNQTNITQAQQIYKKIVVNPYGALK